LDVAQPDAGELRDLIMSGGEHDGPGDLASLDGGLDERARTLEARA
jgi:hypothetical protein